jgi:hypothetical protein
MNFADIENVWRSPHNRPSPAELEKQKMKLVADLRRRRRGFAIFITLVFAVLAAMTGRLVFHVLWAAPSTSSDIDFSQEWGVLLLFPLPWLAALFFYREYRRHRLRHVNAEQSIGASVRALLDENRLARTRLKWVSVLHGAVLLVLPLVVYQLRAVGKAGDEILLPAFVLWPAIAIGILLALRFHDRRTLLPRKLQLEALLNSYEQ